MSSLAELTLIEQLYILLGIAGLMGVFYFLAHQRAKNLSDRLHLLSKEGFEETIQNAQKKGAYEQHRQATLIMGILTTVFGAVMLYLFSKNGDIRFAIWSAFGLSFGINFFAARYCVQRSDFTLDTKKWKQLHAVRYAIVVFAVLSMLGFYLLEFLLQHNYWTIFAAAFAALNILMMPWYAWKVIRKARS